MIIEKKFTLPKFRPGRVEQRSKHIKFAQNQFKQVQPLTFNIASPGEMLSVAQSILKTFPENRIYILNGDLGSGKTTLVKAFARALNIIEDISSPTFSIVHEYG